MQPLKELKRRDRASRVTNTIVTVYMHNDRENLGLHGIDDSMRKLSSPLEPGTDRIHIRLDYVGQRHFWDNLSFSLAQLRGWMEAEGCYMQWQQEEIGVDFVI